MKIAISMLGIAKRPQVWLVAAAMPTEQTSPGRGVLPSRRTARLLRDEDLQFAARVASIGWLRGRAALGRRSVCRGVFRSKRRHIFTRVWLRIAAMFRASDGGLWRQKRQAQLLRQGVGLRFEQRRARGADIDPPGLKHQSGHARFNFALDPSIHQLPEFPAQVRCLIQTRELVGLKAGLRTCREVLERRTD